MNKSQTNNKRTNNRHTLNAAIMLILFGILGGRAVAQNQPTPSTDRDNPAQLARGHRALRCQLAQAREHLCKP